MTLFEKALIFAVDKHTGMRRKLDGAQYILHPMEAAVIISGMSDDEELLAAALLHDVVEDTDATMEEIKFLFGSRVAELVASETEDKRPGVPRSESWRIRKEESLERLARSNTAEKMLWLGDKLSNIRALCRMKAKLGDGVWKFFNNSDPSQHAWYYRSIAELLSELSGYDAWQEYNRLVQEAFAEADKK